MTILTPMDTGVHAVGKGYERTILFAERLISPTLVLLKVDIRVDRLPEKSSATISEWNTDTKEWQEFERFGASRFWYDVPGWERFASDRTDRSTYRVALELLEVVRLAYANPVS